jgi:hypothetical protein
MRPFASTYRLNNRKSSSIKSGGILNGFHRAGIRRDMNASRCQHSGHSLWSALSFDWLTQHWNAILKRIRANEPTPALLGAERRRQSTNVSGTNVPRVLLRG